jgi:hypothetical protein
MTNEMKLITALCDALGFEVEKTCVNKEDAYYNLTVLPPFSRKLIYEYKLTKSVEKELTLDEKAVEDYVSRNEAMLTKQVEDPFTKIKESDEIFNTEMFGEVRISRSMEYGTRIDTKKNGQYFTNFVDDSVCISHVIKFIDCMYSAREKA